MRRTGLEERVQAEVEAGRLLGAALAVLDGDEIVAARGFGTTAVDVDGAPVTPTTLFGIASLTKSVLATAVMRLVERGVLDLDTPVVRYVPGLALSDPALGARVTLRHLLSHTSGLGVGGKDWGPPDRDALARFVHEQLARYAFLAEPGRVHLYSNTAICLAGYVIEVVTKTPGRDLIAELVFDPLGMSRSTYDHAVAMTHRVAVAHEEDEAGRLRAVHRYADNRSGEPAGFAIAPVVDVANLALVLLDEGRFRGDPFLSPASVREMQTPWADRRVRAHSHPVARQYEHYGLGLQLGRYRGVPIVRHGGTIQSFNHFLQLFPDRRRGLVLLTNYGDEARVTELVFALQDALLELPEGDAQTRSVLVPVVEPAPDRAEWPRYEGTYLDVPRGRLATVAATASRLELVESGRGFGLTAVAPGAYFFEEDGVRQPVEFVVAEDSEAAEYLFFGGNPYRRHRPGPGFAPDPAVWPSLAGEYEDPSNADEGRTLEVRLGDGRLRMTGDWIDEELVPFGPAAFLSSLGLIEFEPGGAALAVGRATRYLRSGPAGTP
jgi:CubicO group peptidase (beta-lactamase class C family)